MNKAQCFGVGFLLGWFVIWSVTVLLFFL